MKKLFEPLTVKSLHVKNRMVVSAMSSRMANRDGTLTEKQIAYYEAKAKGGWGLIITEDYCISPTAGANPILPGLYCDAQIANHKLLTDRIHQAGGAVVCQIYHAGREAMSASLSGVPLVGPSAEYHPGKREFVQELSVEEIQCLVNEFADCALRVKQAGFDGVEIHGASGYLLGQFVSPYFNKRTDEYGGTTAGRCRFSTEVIRAVRQKVGDDFTILYRMAVNEYVEGGLDVAEAEVVALLMEQAGVDILHCTQGVLAKTRPFITPAYHISKGNFIENTAAIKAVVSVPVIGVGGRVNDPHMAEKILQTGKADFVTMARASIADPALPNKAKAGQMEDIIQCIGCVQGCQGGAARGEGIRCLVNPLTGMEAIYQIQPTDVKKKIFVAGGGVSGCEFALMAAKRGHDVTLYESTSCLGGQWRAAAVPIGKAEFAGFIQWQRRQLEKAGVTIRLNSALTKEIVLEEKPEIVVIATGNVPFIPPIKGLREAPYVLAKDVLLGKAAVGNHVLVIGGGLVGAETAEFLAERGAQVVVAEMLPEIAKEAGANPRRLLLESLKRKDVVLYTATKVTAVINDIVYLEKEGAEVTLSGIDTIVVAAGGRSNCELRDMLQNYEGKIITIGDANKVKDGLFNIREGFEAALTI